MMKCAIYTLGCKVNQYESEALGKALKERGVEVLFGLSVADSYILNSCAVTNEAEHKSREILAKMRKLNPDAKIYVCGCSSELHTESFAERENVIAVIGTEAKDKLVDLIMGDVDFLNKQDICDKLYNDNYKIDGERIRSYLKIQDGCNNFCSYCIIPYLRGRERSREIESIIEEYSRISKVSKEVVLVGINLSHYGSEKNSGEDLTRVIEELSRFKNVRLRISSLEQDAINERLLNALKKHQSFCPSFHIPLQSGSEEVLRKMNRHYGINEYKKAIKMIRDVFPNASISTDLIVGFPTETEEDFKECLLNVEEIGFSSMHIFPFSKREGTACDRYNQLDGKVVKRRIEEMKKVADKSREGYILKQIGLADEVLVEEEADGEFIGYTKNYLKCYLNSKSDIKNEIIKVKIVEKYKNGVRGEIVNEWN